MRKKAAHSDIATLGFRVHSGWAAAVALNGDLRAPIVLDRRRIELADSTLPGSVQPFHAAKTLHPKAAEELILRCRESTDSLAEAGLREMLDDLRRMNVRVVGGSILLASGRSTGSLESILTSHALIHTAEGEFFRDSLRRTMEKCSIPVSGIKERGLLNQASSELALPPEEIPLRAAEMGRPLGPPWREDEKLATIAAWLVLARGHSLEGKSGAQKS